MRAVSWLLIVYCVATRGGHVDGADAPVPMRELPLADEFPKWEFALASRVNERATIYLVSNWSWSELTPEFKSAVAPAWSPDGTKLAFQGVCDAEHSEIYVLTLASGKFQRLTTNEADDSFPSWSPDGKTIAFTSSRGGKQSSQVSIYLMDADGQNERRMNIAVDDALYPAWSPDGKRITFIGTKEQTQRPSDLPNIQLLFNDIYVASVDGSGVTKLTGGDSFYTTPSWSPDGRQIVYSSNQHLMDRGVLEFRVYAMTIDGKNVRQLTTGTGQDSAPRYSPDGSSIIFQSVERKNGREFWKDTGEIYMMRPDGSNRQRLTMNSNDDFFAAFRPVLH